MSRSFVLALVLGACGGTTVDPLLATFPLGPSQATMALAERWPESVDLEGGTWTGAAGEVDVVAVRSAVLDVGERGAELAARDVRPWPATVTADLSDGPFVKVELLVGPADASGVDDPRVVSVADGEVPRRAGDLARLVWRERGVDSFVAAMTGTLEGQGGAARVTLFLRGTASLRLAPGTALPEGEADVTVDVPLRSYP